MIASSLLICVLSLAGTALAIVGAELPAPARGSKIAGSYFVMFDRSAPLQALEALAADRNLKTAHLLDETEHESFAMALEGDGFGGVLYGKFSPEDLEDIQKHPQFVGVEQEQVFTVDAPVPASSPFAAALGDETLETEHDAPWGLSRISQRENVLDGSEPQPTGDYYYSSFAGANVTAYVVDTGVYIAHEQFEGRAVWGKTIPRGDRDIDGNGHGSHVAGTIGSRSYGVAKKCTIVAVKVLRSNGSGTTADVVRGITWTAQDFTEKRRKDPNFRATANMSLGGGKSTVIDAAVNAAVRAGVSFAVAAGNEDQDACMSSPAAAADPITVAASTVQDSRAYFSNWGKCVDIFAPGLDITSTWNSKDSRKTISGTSMASPHVCGEMTLLLSQPEFAKLTPQEIKKHLVNTGTKDVLTDTRRSVNVLLFSAPPCNETATAVSQAANAGFRTEF